MNGTIRIDYTSSKAEAAFTCPFCGGEQVREFRARIVTGRLNPDPVDLVRQHLQVCPDHKSTDYKDREIEQDYRILVRMDGLKVTQTRRAVPQG